MLVYDVPKEAVCHLLITHPHYDHFQPIGIQNFSFGLPHPLNVYGSSSVVDALNFARIYRWDKSEKNFKIHRDNSNIQAKTVSHGENFSLGKISATAVWSNHLLNKGDLIFGGQALNYVLERGGKTLFYGLDSSYVLPKSFEVLSRFQFDIAIFDASFGHLEIDPFGSGHQNFAMLDKTIAQFRRAHMFKKNAVIVADHISQEYVEPHDEIVDELSRKGIILAYDGMVLEF